MITRRSFGAAVATGASLLAGSAYAASLPPARKERRFPKSFRWGCATAAYQVEGAVNEDGRGTSIWDVFAHTPGKIANGDTGDVACDSYHRFREDTQLLKSLGANSYRFSIGWPRIFPEGRGKPNPKGVDHYNRLVDDLLANGIEPFVTLYHWDLPAALPGGWQTRDTAKAFADYAGFMAAQLSDRVDHFMTMNEIRSFVEGGYGGGIHAPGLRLPTAALHQVGHHAILGHGLAVRTMRASAKRPIKIGLAENADSPVPIIATPENIAAARLAMRALNAPYLTTILDGRYPEERLTAQAKPPKIEDGDMAIIGSPIDFVGINVYAPIYVRAAPDTKQGFSVVQTPTSFPSMTLPWLKVGPEAAYWAVRLSSEVWKPKSIYITENGCAADDHLLNCKVNDVDRVMFLRNYVANFKRTIDEGYPLKGYFLWSLLDNFEWAEGYARRFGIHYIDFATQRRIPKLSAEWYRELIKQGTLV